MSFPHRYIDGGDASKIDQVFCKSLDVRTHSYSLNPNRDVHRRRLVFPIHGFTLSPRLASFLQCVMWHRHYGLISHEFPSPPYRRRRRLEGRPSCLCSYPLCRYFSLRYRSQRFGFYIRDNEVSKSDAIH